MLITTRMVERPRGSTVSLKATREVRVSRPRRTVTHLPAAVRRCSWTTRPRKPLHAGDVCAERPRRRARERDRRVHADRDRCAGPALPAGQVGGADPRPRDVAPRATCGRQHGCDGDRRASTVGLGEDRDLLAGGAGGHGAGQRDAAAEDHLTAAGRDRDAAGGEGQVGAVGRAGVALRDEAIVVRRAVLEAAERRSDVLRPGLRAGVLDGRLAPVARAGTVFEPPGRRSPARIDGAGDRGGGRADVRGGARSRRPAQARSRTSGRCRTSCRRSSRRRSGSGRWWTPSGRRSPPPRSGRSCPSRRSWSPSWSRTTWSCRSRSARWSPARSASQSRSGAPRSA